MSKIAQDLAAGLEQADRSDLLDGRSVLEAMRERLRNDARPS
jgi:hypothetical protein